MSTTTQKILSIPETGVTPQFSSIGVWAGCPWKVIAPKTNEEMAIFGISFMYIQVAAADTNYEFIIEIGFGEAGYETVRIQWPQTIRSDTSVGYFMPVSFTLPEPVFVPKGTVVSIRYQTSSGTAQWYGHFKLMVLTGVLKPIQPTEQINIQNQHSIRVGSGMSVSERGGSFR